MKNKEEVSIIVDAIIKICQSLEQIREEHLEIKDLIKVIGRR